MKTDFLVLNGNMFIHSKKHSDKKKTMSNILCIWLSSAHDKQKPALTQARQREC